MAEQERKYVIRVPCSSANIGPGFDVIGLALSMYLELRVTIHKPAPEASESRMSEPPPTSRTPPPPSTNCTITYTGVSPSSVPLSPTSNLITQSALYLLRCNSHHTFPHPIHIHIHNPIPLGRGLGSSGAAVVAGILLGNLAGDLALPKSRLLDYSLMIERHPDNVAAALYGGFVGTYLSELNPEDMARKEIPLSEVLPAPAGGVDTGLKPPEPPVGIGHYRRFGWAKEIKAVAVIPDFEVATARAREVLPSTYSRQDMVFNLQRLALLTTALGDSPPDANLIYQAMQDKVHQPYRQTLIPGLTEILQSVTPATHRGLLGVCLSGAGPTILALATENFESIAQVIMAGLKREGITSEWKVLEPANDGATVEELS